MVAATAALLQRRGYHGTGLRDIVAVSGAPQGSLYFHFPGGKDELACRALAVAGEAWRARIERLFEDVPVPFRLQNGGDYIDRRTLRDNVSPGHSGLMAHVAE